MDMERTCQRVWRNMAKRWISWRLYFVRKMWWSSEQQFWVQLKFTSGQSIHQIRAEIIQWVIHVSFLCVDICHEQPKDYERALGNVSLDLLQNLSMPNLDTLHVSIPTVESWWMWWTDLKWSPPYMMKVIKLGSLWMTLARLYNCYLIVFWLVCDYFHIM